MKVVGVVLAWANCIVALTILWGSAGDAAKFYSGVQYQPKPTSATQLEIMILAILVLATANTIYIWLTVPKPEKDPQ